MGGSARHTWIRHKVQEARNNAAGPVDGRLAGEFAEGAHGYASTDFTDCADEMRKWAWGSIGVIGGWHLGV